jgi:hypothetical protein
MDFSIFVKLESKGFHNRINANRSSIFKEVSRAFDEGHLTVFINGSGRDSQEGDYAYPIRELMAIDARGKETKIEWVSLAAKKEDNAKLDINSCTMNKWLLNLLLDARLSKRHYYKVLYCFDVSNNTLKPDCQDLFISKRSFDIAMKKAREAGIVFRFKGQLKLSPYHRLPPNHTLSQQVTLMREYHQGY